MKIVVYIAIIAIVALVIFGIVYAVQNNIADIGDTVDGAINTAADWISEQANYIGSLLGE